MNAFTQAREDNLAQGTMTKGKVDVPHVVQPAQYAAQPPPSSLSGKLYSVTVNGRTVTVQGEATDIENLRGFLVESGLTWDIKPIHLLSIDVLKAGLMFAMPATFAAPPMSAKKKAAKKRTKKAVAELPK